MFTTTAYIIYLIVSLAMTVWVGRTLHRNGRPFLVEMFERREALADAVNRLLLVGFYLVNAGFVTLALRFGSRPTSGHGAIEFVSTKFGVVLLVLGVMYFSTILGDMAFHRHQQRRRRTEPDRKALEAQSVTHLARLREAGRSAPGIEALPFDSLQ